MKDTLTHQVEHQAVHQGSFHTWDAILAFPRVSQGKDPPPSPSSVHLFRRWNPTMILTMVIISTMTTICIIRHKHIMTIIAIITVSRLL